MENNYSQYVDKKTLFYYMQLAIDYYCNGTITGHIMIPSQDSTYLTHYLMLAIHQSLNNEIRVNETELALMRELFDNYIITNLNNMTISSIEYMEDLTDTFLIDCMSISEVFLWLALVVYLLEIVIYSKMWNNLTILVKMLTQLPEKYISSSEKLLEMLQERTQLTQFSEFKRSSVLDLLNLPCALADEDNYIISTNRLWLAFYNESPDCVIGRDVHDFLKTTEAKYEEKEVNGTQKLIIINEKKREKEYKKRLKTLKEKVLNLRSVIIPRRFLKEKEQTEFDIKFIINCCIIMSPAKTGDENNDRLNPDEWITDAKEYEQWIVERCEICDDVDILRGSCRELMLLFGVNERSSPHLLAVTALTIVIDSMRRGLEYRWRSGGIDICTTISCGFDSKFILKRDSTAMIDMLGDAFSKQMALREKIELNSIICDREIMEILSQCKFGVEFDQIDNDAFIFSFDMAPENSNIRSSSIY